MELATERILAKCSVKDDVVQYRQAIQRWCDHPHYVNRRLSGSVVLFSGEVQHPENSQELHKLVGQAGLSSDMDATAIMNSLSNCDVLMKLASETPDPSESEHGVFIVLKKLIPRNSSVFKEMLEITILDFSQNEAIFIGLPTEEGCVSTQLAPTHPYGIRYVAGEIHLVVFSASASESKSSVWLRDTLLPKLQRWTEEKREHSPVVAHSLSLVSAEKYALLYQELKEKYGQKMVQIWPENTDPSKFVYEDVAIASYLLLLWEEQRKQSGRPAWKQSFVDLGCGNGLLVYILSSEGHTGIGIDVRSRGIWNLYPSSTQLKVQTFVPSDCNLFPEADWVIGNHSDELTPWIPVIAARSSYKCSFFLLPCCAYDFSGRKYRRKDSSRSQYLEYLDYVKHICQKCGFETLVDRLKIPSTKRICLVGSERNYSEDDFKGREREIMEYVQKEVESVITPESAVFPNKDHSLAETEEWIACVKTREAKERARNCTQLQKGVVDGIVQHVVKLLLSENCSISTKDEKGEEKKWNAGRCMKLNEVVASVPQNLLKQLKNECGGLQTLLKNNHQIFSVANGKVKIAVPGKKEEKGRRAKNKQRKVVEIKVKQKPCWFYNFHPDGCLLRNEECTFRH